MVIVHPLEKILPAEGPKVLFALAHEFGHLLYQIPNVAEYRDLYQKMYAGLGSNCIEKGHHQSDPGALRANRVENHFYKSYHNYRQFKKQERLARNKSENAGRTLYADQSMLYHDK